VPGELCVEHRRRGDAAKFRESLDPERLPDVRIPHLAICIPDGAMPLGGGSALVAFRPRAAYHAAVGDSHDSRAWDVEGPIRAEIFLVRLDGDHLELAGPDGARPWTVQLNDGEDPVEVVERIVAGLVGPPLVVHSTSWRRAGSAVILSFVVAVRPEQTAAMEGARIPRAELARSDATRAPERIGHDQVLEHGLRHLAWLLQDDAAVAERLSPGWRAPLADYVPEPFRSFS